jgi:hypothetical protein
VRDGNLRTNLDKNRRARDARGYIDHHHRESEEWELWHRVEYDREYGPPLVVHRIMEHEERNCHNVENRRHAQYEADYSHPEGPVPNPDHQPRSQAVAPAQSQGGTQAGDGSDDMAITAFPALPPRLRSLTYPDNFKTNI